MGKVNVSELVQDTQVMVKEENTMVNEVITSTEAIESVKEEAVMGTEIKDTAVIEETAVQTEEKLPKFSDVINPANEDRKMILVTAIRNKNTKLFWDFLTVLEGADVKETIKLATDNKLIILIDERYARKFVETGTVLRGMASTVSDLSAKYAKVMGIEVEDKAVLVKTLIEEVLNAVDTGVTSGVWAKPEVLQEEAKTEAPEETAEAVDTETVEDPFDVTE